MKFGNDRGWEEYKERIYKNFSPSKVEAYIVCGVGKSYESLMKHFPEISIKYCLDKNCSEIRKRGILCYGYESLKEIVSDDLQKEKFIVTPGHGIATEIKVTLSSLGIKDENIITLDEFLFFFMKEKYNKLFLEGVGYVIHSYCTLKCKGCVQYKDYDVECFRESMEEMEHNLDMLFDVVSGCRDLSILGGEIFLHTDFKRILKIAYDKYSDRVDGFSTVTNATIIPDDETFITMHECGLRIHISDYHLPDQKIEDFCGKCEEFDVTYIRNNQFNRSAEDVWFDIGSPFEEIRCNDIRKKFLKCSDKCIAYSQGKLFSCNIPWAMVQGRVRDLPKNNDYIEMKECVGKNIEDNFNTIGAFRYGFVPLGYYEACRWCKGFGIEVNAPTIVAGTQVG